MAVRRTLVLLALVLVPVLLLPSTLPEPVSARRAPAVDGPRPGGPSSPRLPLNALPLSLDSTHPSGVSVRLTGVAVESDRVLVGVVLANEGTLGVWLNGYDDFVLIDERGVRYPLVAPPDDRRVTVQGGAVLREVLVFSGHPEPDAGPLRLVTNSGRGSTRAYTRFPRVTVEGVPRPREPESRPRRTGHAGRSTSASGPRAACPQTL